MPRGVLFDESLNRTIRDALPESVVGIIELSTHLGDGATVAAIAVLLYWFSSEQRRVRVYVVAVGLGALAISTGLKGVFTVARPDPALLAFAPVEYGGFSFPSAHALGSAAIYSMLALTLEVGRRWQRFLVAGVLIALVMLSRVVIGVHYVGDVLVGATVGVLFVAIMFRDSPEFHPGVAFALAFVLGVLGYGLGEGQHSLLVIGASLGGGLTWWAVADVDANPTGAGILVLGVVTLPLLLVFRGATYLFYIHPLTQVAGYAIITSFVLLVPFFADRLNQLPLVQWLQTTLPFRGRRIELESQP